MNPEIRMLFNDTVLHHSAARFGFDPTGLTDQHGFQNFVYAASRNGKPYILRIAHSSHRTAEHIQAEMDWLTYLTGHGVSAAVPVRTLDDELLVTVGSGDSYFIATAFTRAPGVKPQYRSYKEDGKLIRELGRMTGKIHALSGSYTVQQNAPIRGTWRDNHYLTQLHEYIPESYAYLMPSVERFLTLLSGLPHDKGSFGLIHGDIHLNNFHVDGDKLMLFDFDECEYSWFACDIANPLFYVTPLPSDGMDHRNDVAQRFYDLFMDGYSMEHTLPTYSLQQLPHFLRLRELLVLSGAFRSLDLTNLHPWSKEMMEFTCRNLEYDQPYLDIRFS